MEAKEWLTPEIFTVKTTNKKKSTLRRRVPPQREQRIRERPSERNYIAENTGVVRYEAPQSLGLGMGSSETDVKNGDDESRRTSVGRQRNATEMIQWNREPEAVSETS